MHIANPDQAVALNAVPNIILHVQMHRIGARFPNPVQQFIIAAEGADVGKVHINQDALYPLQHQILVLIQQVDAHKPEARFTNADHAHIRQIYHHVAYSVVIGGVLLSAQLAHGLHGGFAKANPDICMVLAAGQPGKNFDTAVDFSTKIQQNRSAVFRRAVQDAAVLGLNGNLSGPVLHKRLAVGYRTALPQHLLRRNIKTLAVIRLHLFTDLFVKHIRDMGTIFHFHCSYSFNCLTL